LVSDIKGRIYERRFLKRIFGPKRDEVIGVWGKLHNEELHKLFSLLNIIRMIKLRRMRWAGNIACMEEKKNAYRVLLRRQDRKAPLGRPRRRKEDNIKIDLREKGWYNMECIDLAQNSNQ
jgi:hypothetical protein